MLRIIKLVHTVVWFIMACASLYILYAGIMGLSGSWLMICVILLVIESVVLASNNWICPMTPLAARYTNDRSANFDIYLPLLVAKYNKFIFGTIFILGLLLNLRNFFLQR